MPFVLLYGSNSWKGIKEVEDRIRRFDSKCLRRIMKIHLFDHVSEEELRRRTGQQRVVEKKNQDCTLEKKGMDNLSECPMR